MFRERMASSKIVATDLEPAYSDVIQWDYHETKPEWLGAFDIVYSNSLDHSHKPGECLRGWLSQLKPDGRLYLQWTQYHRLTAKNNPNEFGGDCFGAGLWEYIELCNRVGEVQNLIYLKSTPAAVTIRVILVVGRKADG